MAISETSSAKTYEKNLMKIINHYLRMHMAHNCIQQIQTSVGAEITELDSFIIHHRQKITGPNELFTCQSNVPHGHPLCNELHFQITRDIVIRPS
jgi:hypothetical protein